MYKYGLTFTMFQYPKWFKRCLNPEKSILVEVKFPVKHPMIRQRMREEVGERDLKENVNKTLKHYSRHAHFHLSHDGGFFYHPTQRRHTTPCLRCFDWESCNGRNNTHAFKKELLHIMQKTIRLCHPHWLSRSDCMYFSIMNNGAPLCFQI